MLQKPLTQMQASRCFNAALNFMVRERRRYSRHPVEIPLRICLPNNEELAATSTNVSEGGMAIRSSASCPRIPRPNFASRFPPLAFRCN